MQQRIKALEDILDVEHITLIYLLT
ncbi:MAG TPA: hypothetical protein ACHBX0_07910 [Arsenophonus sp.]